MSAMNSKSEKTSTLHTGTKRTRSSSVCNNYVGSKTHKQLVTLQAVSRANKSLVINGLTIGCKLKGRDTECVKESIRNVESVNDLRTVKRGRVCTRRGQTVAPKEKTKNEQLNVVPKKPPKFSFVVEGLVAGHGRPTKPGHIEYLVQNNFKYIVTLTENKPRALREYPGTGLQWVHVPVKDETPPSVQQIHQIVELVYTAQNEKVAVSVHCAWGRGRTGTILACFLARYLSLEPVAAITTIRERRPGSIDTQKQEQAVHDYLASLK